MLYDTTREEKVKCWLCDFWWLILLLLFLILAAFLTRDLWGAPPRQQTEPTPIPTEIPTNIPLPTLTPTLVLGTGDVQITLLWNNLNDLDLHVIDPFGEEIYYKNANSASNGLLDVDSNRVCRENIRTDPVENIYWPSTKAPIGRYRIQIVHFAQCTEPVTTSFEVKVLVDGKAQTFTGQLTQVGQVVNVYDFERKNPVR